MRHGKKFNHLSRQKSHREAMLANMACSLIEHKKVSTTVAKAKALQKYVEPLLTKSKTDSTHSRRIVFSYLKSKEAVTELFREVSTKIAERPGGYTRILKTGFRIGDNAQMCFIELVDYNDNMLKDAKSKKSSSRRRRGSTKKTEEPIVESKVTTNADLEAPVEKTAEDSESVTTAVEEVKAKTSEEAEPEKKVEDSNEDDTAEEEKKKED